MPQEPDNDDETDDADAPQDWGDDEPVGDPGGEMLQVLGGLFIVFTLFCLVYLGLCANRQVDIFDRVVRGVWLFAGMGIGSALLRVGGDNADEKEPILLYCLPALMIVLVYILFALR